MSKTAEVLRSWSWKIPVCGAAMMLGTMVGGAVATALGLEMPRVEWAASAAEQFVLTLFGGMAFALGLAALNTGLPGRRWNRWLVLAAFGFVINGIGNTLEASIFSTIGGEAAALVIQLPASVFCALAVVLLFDGATDERMRDAVVGWLGRWSVGRLIVRLGFVFIAFPVIYLVVGMAVAPIVTPYYEKLEFLVIPPMATILTILAIRSLLLLVVSLTVIAAWSRSKAQLVAALAMGHFATVGLAGLIQASFFPMVMRWTHGAEILVDSVLYALVLAWLLFPRSGHAESGAPSLREQHA